MNKHTAEKLVFELEQALQNLRQAHHIALLECDGSQLSSFNELCAKIVNEIDQGLIAPVYTQHSKLQGLSIEILEAEDFSGYEVIERKL